MLLTKLKRVIRAGFINFWRNGVVSLASVFVMSVALFVIGSVVLSSAVFSSLITQVKDKVDINVYLKTDASENDILVLQKSLQLLPEVKSAEYISRETALTQFKELHKDNDLIIGALQELQNNPLGAVLNIRAKEPSQYESIAKFLATDSALGSSQPVIIDKVNFYQNKIVIDRLSKLLALLQKLGLVVTIILVLIAVLVTINTIRVAIYAAREEIVVMKLVGASNNYTRGPFLTEGMMCGMVAAVITTLIFYPVALWITTLTSTFLDGINLLSYYWTNLGQLFLLLLLSGIFVGGFSSWLAVRRYLGV